jgi:AraC-like DNA-binding protein/ligand-binding sensor protein
MTSPISLDLLLSDEVCRLLDSFAAAMKIQVVFYSRSGEILRRGRSFGNSSYCDAMQKHLFGSEKCIALDRAMQKKSLESGEVCCYRCHAGLNELIAPVRIFGKVAGFIMFGQFRTAAEPPEFTAGHPDVRKSFYELPFFAPEDTGSLEDMAKVLLDYIAARELISAPGSFRYQKLLYFIDGHLTEKISLHQAAKHLNISDSSLSHFLRNEHGTSFKTLLISRRLDAAERIIRTDPSVTIAEAARQAGFDDPHYFSRLYRKKRGVPPSAILNR